MTATTLTESEFAAHQDKLDAALRSTKSGTPERVAVVAATAAWEAAIALPVRTVDQRNARLVAIYAAAQVSL